MNERFLWPAFATVALAAACAPGPSPRAPGLALERALGDQAGDEQFLKVTQVPDLSFPRDHASHPDYRQEWWYFTGNLSTADGRRFGYQATIFRFALGAGEAREANSAWHTDQLYMGHFALTDIDGKRFGAADRFARGALGLAGAQLDPLRVWVEDWSVTEGAGPEAGPFDVQLAFADAQFAATLSLSAERPILLQGDRGYSRKGDDPGNASAYYSISRLRTDGLLEAFGATYEVSGTSWFDREWGTSFLAPGVAGWDWFSLHLDDGRDLMFYRLRSDEGTATPWSAGTLARETASGDWQVERLSDDQVALEVRRTWLSPASGVRYPVSWELTLADRDLTLQVEAALDDQELRLATRYWEGAVIVRGRQGDTPVGGRGYLELAGYE